MKEMSWIFLSLKFHCISQHHSWFIYRLAIWRCLSHIWIIIPDCVQRRIRFKIISYRHTVCAYDTQTAYSRIAVPVLLYPFHNLIICHCLMSFLIICQGCHIINDLVIRIYLIKQIRIYLHIQIHTFRNLCQVADHQFINFLCHLLPIYLKRKNLHQKQRDNRCQCKCTEQFMSQFPAIIMSQYFLPYLHFLFLQSTAHS